MWALTYLHMRILRTANVFIGLTLTVHNDGKLELHFLLIGSQFIQYWHLVTLAVARELVSIQYRHLVTPTVARVLVSIQY